ncbi:ABC transporter ATP-binding protein [Actinomyces faecalis]|uniref:ABC transporter ATP-binding protein n=1 Tax=Actinomyces faecalis TaxID=2722820 RepID=UPI001557594B|nr:ABC transporter ATP-binding protein [Actinomyces faecalis]
MAPVAVSISNVSKRFRVYKNRNQSLKGAFLQRSRGTHEDFWALRDIDLEIPEGKTFGLLGHNGSGKSTLLKCIAKILTPDSGSITSRGRMAAMLEVGSGFHPELSGRENIYLNGEILGMSRKEIDRKFDDIVDFSGVGAFIEQPVKNYSSGMYVRLGFSVSIHVEPDILLVDEVLAVGDLDFQERCLGKFADFRQEGRTVIVVSHGLEQMRTFCDQAAWLDRGTLQGVGPAAPLIDRYSALAHGAEPVSGGGIRFGSGEAQIERIEVLDARGRPAHGFHVGEEMTLRLHYRAHEELCKPVFGVSVDTKDGQVVWGLHGLDAGFQPARILPGEGSVDVHIPKLMLRPNTYVVQASIQPPHLTTVIDALQRSTGFEVLPGPLMESGGLVALGASFGNLMPPAPLAQTPVREAPTQEGPA